MTGLSIEQYYKKEMKGENRGRGRRFKDIESESKIKQKTERVKRNGGDGRE